MFVLQVSGEKHWSVHAPVREHPRPDEPWSERRAAVQARACEDPLIDVVMRPGDALYLPSGWLHSAVARHGTSIHLTIGVAALAGADVVRELVAEIARSPELRAPLPINRADAGPDVLIGAVENVAAAFAEALEVLRAGEGPARTASAVRRSSQRTIRPAPVAPLAAVEAANDLSPKTAVRMPDGLTAHVDVDPDGVHLAADGQALRFPAACETALRALASGERLWSGALPELDEPDSLVVARRLPSTPTLTSASHASSSDSSSGRSASATGKPARPASDMVSSAVRAVTITQLPGWGSQEPALGPVTLTDPPQVGKLVALIDALSLPPIPPDAPCAMAPGPYLSLAFRARLGGPALAVAETDQNCGTVSLTLNGQPAPALSEQRTT